MDRYREFEQHEDLGLGFPPADDTDDIVGAKREDLVPGGAGDEVDCPKPLNKERTR